MNNNFLILAIFLILCSPFFLKLYYKLRLKYAIWRLTRNVDRLCKLIDKLKAEADKKK